MRDGLDDAKGDLAERATSLRGQRTEAKLRAAALEAFDALGWRATRVEDVVTRAGVSHGTFYTYFANKTDLLDALVRDSRSDYAALASEPWTGDDVRGALEGAIGGFLDLYARDVVIMRTWLQAAREDAHFSDLYLKMRRAFVTRIAENLEAAAAVSGHPTSSLGAVASALAAMVEHFAYCWLVLGEPHERDAAVEAVVLVWGAALNTVAGRRLVDVSTSMR